MGRRFFGAYRRYHVSGLLAAIMAAVWGTCWRAEAANDIEPAVTTETAYLTLYRIQTSGTPTFRVSDTNVAVTPDAKFVPWYDRAIDALAVGTVVAPIGVLLIAGPMGASALVASAAYQAASGASTAFTLSQRLADMLDREGNLALTRSTDVRGFYRDGRRVTPRVVTLSDSGTAFFVRTISSDHGRRVLTISALVAWFTKHLGGPFEYATTKGLPKVWGTIADNTFESGGDSLVVELTSGSEPQTTIWRQGVRETISAGVSSRSGDSWNSCRRGALTTCLSPLPDLRLFAVEAVKAIPVEAVAVRADQFEVRIVPQAVIAITPLPQAAATGPALQVDWYEEREWRRQSRETPASEPAPAAPARVDPPSPPPKRLDDYRTPVPKQITVTGTICGTAKVSQQDNSCR